MSYDDDDPDYTEIKKILNEYELPHFVIDDVVVIDDNGRKKTESVSIDTSDPIDQQEIEQLMTALYTAADRKSPIGRRTDDDITKLTKIQKILEDNLKKKKQIEDNSEDYRASWQKWAERERKKTELSLKQQKTENNKGGKSRVFRRKNKKMTSTSKRNLRRTRRTRRHRKSSTRRSTRK